MSQTHGDVAELIVGVGVAVTVIAAWPIALRQRLRSALALREKRCGHHSVVVDGKVDISSKWATIM